MSGLASVFGGLAWQVLHCAVMAALCLPLVDVRVSVRRALTGQPVPALGARWQMFGVLSRRGRLGGFACAALVAVLLAVVVTPSFTVAMPGARQSDLLVILGLLGAAQCALVAGALWAGSSRGATAVVDQLRMLGGLGVTFVLVGVVVAVAAGGSVESAVTAAHAGTAATLPLACAGLALLLVASVLGQADVSVDGLVADRIGADRAAHFVASDLVGLVLLTLASDLVAPLSVAGSGHIGACLSAMLVWVVKMLAGAAGLGVVDALSDRFRRVRRSGMALMLAVMAVLMLFVERLQ